MGIYLNPGSVEFQESLNSQIYVDKTGLIEKTNAAVRTAQKYMCISRPRRFGKSMAADMLAAYYGREEDSTKLFAPFKISKSPSFSKHLNQYDVLKINMQEFLSETNSMDEMLARLARYLIYDLQECYSQIRFRDKTSLMQVMKDIFAATKRPFVILIDEWDCLFREYQQDKEAQKQYLDFLRAWLKDKSYVALAYMTGILPVKKYGSHSALNMFTEYSMTDPGDLAEFFGFTEDEVSALCQQYDMNFEETKSWYDGYGLCSHSQHGDVYYSMYSPKSVVESMLRHKFGTYWNRTETYEALKVYIQINMDGLKDAVVEMLAGGNVRINTGTFSNDMTTFATRDDILTLLVHLGYLTYDTSSQTVSIPNKEVSQEYINAISTMEWKEVTSSVNDSRKLLEALWNMDEAKVAAGIEKVHEEVSALQYNDENSLSCVVNLAFYFAREYYNIVREYPSGKGFADICFIPRPMHMDKPAVIVKLKWDKSVESAISQIKERNYVSALKDYRGSLILAGVTYEKKDKKHSCKIEKIKM